MTESSRREHIRRALLEVRDRQDRGNNETYRLPLRGTMVLDVIDVPLSVLILNGDSFRIAPQLEDHPRRELVKSDPESPGAQAVIAELVRAAHRRADDLKENLLDEGQTQPGVITRDGKLVNANTRCVLLRELAREGKAVPTTLRVAVLPGDVTNHELLELEMVLQQQVELKDEYRLINRLMMVQRLHEENFTDDQIARKLRKDGKSGTRNGAQKIKEQREVLRLMERARRLLSKPLPITDFDSEVDQYQNWAELLRETARIEASEGSEAADLHIRRWLIAYFSGINSVHKLRNAMGDWVENDGVVDGVQESPELRSILQSAEIDASSAGSRNPTSQRVPAGTEGDEASLSPPSQDLSNLDLLGTSDPIVTPQAKSVAAILEVVAAAHKAGDEPVALPDGTEVAGSEVKEQVRGVVQVALSRARQRRDAGGRLIKPISELERSRAALASALEALREVASDSSFNQGRRARQLVDEIAEMAGSMVAILEQERHGRPSRESVEAAN
ncbi:hypothetical protein [Micromonospora sp. NPDC047527]|uniref:hypothetical protein n=1 Tax=Micromonospora sp. NPDC047527 TaxID=3155144 RepID=UPI0033EFD560